MDEEDEQDKEDKKMQRSRHRSIHKSAVADYAAPQTLDHGIFRADLCDEWTLLGSLW